AGVAGPPAAGSVRIVVDGANELEIQASLPADGFVVLRDSYDPAWTADVDGVRAELARANGVYRAVHVAAGHHVIRFRFRPRDLLVGLTLSSMTALLLLGMSFNRKRPSRGVGLEAPLHGTGARERGFTLLELMIVLAIIGILLAIAFGQYRNIHSRGNEAS